MKAKVIAVALLALILVGTAAEAWSRVIVLPRRRIIVRHHPVYVYPRPVRRAVYYRYPAVKTVRIPPAHHVCYRYPCPKCYAEEVEVTIEVND